MINFIIYDNDKEMVNMYKEIIRKFMSSNNLKYVIYEYNKYNYKKEYKSHGSIVGKKIYILNSNFSGFNVIDFAKDMRNNGDWLSQIIVINNFDNYNSSSFVARIFMIDFINKIDNIKKDLRFSLEVAFNLINRHSALVFKYNSEIFQVLYSEIYYIEKNLNNNDATIVTKNNNYIVKYSINKLMKILGNDPRFFKSHRSCIINLDNVISFDIENNIVRFKNKEINLVSRDKKRELKDRLISKCNIGEN